MKKNWLISESPDDDTLRLFENSGINKIIGSILFSRGIKEKDALLSFLFPELNHFHSPFIMKGVYNAVARIRKALKTKERKIGRAHV